MTLYPSDIVIYHPVRLNNGLENAVRLDLLAPYGSQYPFSKNASLICGSESVFRNEL